MKVDSVAAIVLAACALIVTGLAVRREAFGPIHSAALQRPVLIPEWQEWLKSGRRIGSGEAPVQVVEFADFECPYCAKFHEALKVARKRQATKVALTYIHFPIPGHRFAIPAARAAECANDQGRFEAMYASRKRTLFLT
jgi:hypothetical protein